MPSFKLFDICPVTKPTSVGPPEQPTSPANARRANMAVPPFFKVADALLKVPGHIMPTDKPQIAQPTSEISGDGDRDIHR